MIRRTAPEQTILRAGAVDEGVQGMEGLHEVDGVLIWRTVERRAMVQIAVQDLPFLFGVVERYR